jgi:hypothetical protein
MVEHIVPPYRALMESYDKAQNVQKVGYETKLNLRDAAKTEKPDLIGHCVCVNVQKKTHLI